MVVKSVKSAVDDLVWRKVSDSMKSKCSGECFGRGTGSKCGRYLIGMSVR